MMQFLPLSDFWDTAMEPCVNYQSRHYGELAQRQFQRSLKH